MQDRWDLAAERLGAATDRASRCEAEREFFEVARELGRKVLGKFHEIPKDERDELVQDAFVRLLENRASANDSKPWFITVVKRLALDVVRSKGHAQRRDSARDTPERDGNQAASPLDLRADAHEGSAEDAVSRPLDARALLALLAPRLSARDLAWLEQVLLGSTHQEIAETNSVQKATVDKAMQRTWEKVRALVPQEELR